MTNSNGNVFFNLSTSIILINSNNIISYIICRLDVKELKIILKKCNKFYFNYAIPFYHTKKLPQLQYFKRDERTKKKYIRENILIIRCLRN